MRYTPPPPTTTRSIFGRAQQLVCIICVRRNQKLSKYLSIHAHPLATFEITIQQSRDACDAKLTPRSTNVPHRPMQRSKVSGMAVCNAHCCCCCCIHATHARLSAAVAAAAVPGCATPTGQIKTCPLFVPYQHFAPPREGHRAGLVC